MKRRVVRYISMVIILVVGMGHSADALSPIVTDTTQLPEVSPLIVTGYLAHLTTATTDTKGKVLTQKLTDIEALELYNAGDTLLDIREWHIVDAGDASRELVFATQFSGMLEPGRHAVLAQPSYVPSATYAITGWTREATNDRAVPGVVLVHDPYRVSQVDIKSSDVMQRRNVGVTGYLTTFSDALPYGMAHVDTMMTDHLFDDGLYVAPSTAGSLQIIEIYPYASDCSPFDTSVLCGDYVKLMNTGTTAISLEGLVLRTDSNSSSRTSSNTTSLTGALNAGASYTVNMTDGNARLSLTNSGGYVWLEDIWGTMRYETTLTHYQSAGSAEQGYSYALAHDGTWGWTTTPSPVGENVITPIIVAPTVCPEGKYRSPDTGRCRNVEEVMSDLAACDEGYERNPVTNRCRKITSTTTTLVPCGEGQERNPTTNRCRSIASAVAELLPCDEGYERNPATNRCRKILVSEMPVAAFPVQPYAATTQTMMGWWIGGGIGVLALLYAVWEWRHEIGGGIRRFTTRLRP